MVTSWPSYFPACSIVIVVIARFSVRISNHQFTRFRKWTSITLGTNAIRNFLSTTAQVARFGISAGKLTKDFAYLI